MSSHSINFMSLANQRTNLYVLSEENIGRRPININNKVIDSIVSNVPVPIHFMLIWSPNCDICHQFIPIYIQVVDSINRSMIKFSVFEVVKGSRISDITRDSLIKLEGVPSIILFINGAGVKNLGYFNTPQEFLLTIKEIITNINNINVRMLDDNEVKSIRERQTSQGNEQPEDRNSINYGQDEKIGALPVTIDIARGSGMNYCPIDDVMNNCMNMGETLNCSGGVCKLDGFTKGRGEREREGSYGVPVDHTRSNKGIEGRKFEGKVVDQLHRDSSGYVQDPRAIAQNPSMNQDRRTRRGR